MPPPINGYAVCTECGETVQRTRLASGDHLCDPDRILDYQVRKVHWRYGAFEDAFRHWLETPAGRFAEFCARRAIGGEARA